MRKISGMFLMILLAFALAACGGDDDNGDDEEAEATEPPAATEVEEEATEAEEEGTPEEEAAATAVADDDDAATPAAGASPVSGADATPVAGTEATPAGMDATPVSGLDATPVTEEETLPDASPIASPVGDPDSATPTSAVVPGTEVGATPSGVVSPVAGASPAADVESTPAAQDVAVPPVSGDEEAPEGDVAETIALNGDVRIEGAENQAWIMTGDGCVGLGNHADMQAGRQVIVRDERGTIVGATELEASDAGDACSWTFGFEVPESEFYAVSIPMKIELVFSHEDVAANDGEVTLVLP